MSFLENLLPVLLIGVPLAISLWVWVETLRAKFQTPLLLPRSEPLPSRTAILFGAGLLVTLLQIALVPGILLLINPDLAKRGEEFNIDLQLFAIRAGVGVDVAILLIGLIAVCQLTPDNRRLVGFHNNQRNSQIQAGMRGFVLSLLPVFLLVLAVSYFRKEEHLHEMLQLIQKEPSFEVIAWTVCSAVIAAPLAEEMLYRVLFQQGLIAAGHPPRIVIPGVALYFCLNHGNPNDPSSYLQTLPLLPLALILGWVYHLRNSFLACVLIHMLFNAFNIMISLLSQL